VSVKDNGHVELESSDKTIPTITFISTIGQFTALSCGNFFAGNPYFLKEDIYLMKSSHEENKFINGPLSIREDRREHSYEVVYQQHKKQKTIMVKRFYETYIDAFIKRIVNYDHKT